MSSTHATGDGGRTATPADPLAIARDAAAVAASDTIAACTMCGRLVPEVDAKDYCAPCAEISEERHLEESSVLLEVLGELLSNFGRSLNRDDVLHLVDEYVSTDAPRAEVDVERLGRHIAEVKVHNAEVKRLRGAR